MMRDILIIMWKEWKEIIIQRGSTRRGIISLLFIVLVLGILPPIQFGPAWVESPFALFLALWIPLMMVSNVVSDSFAGERERHTLETLLASRLSDRGILFGKVATSISYGWGLAMTVIVISLIVANLSHGGEGLLMHSPSMGLRIVLSAFLSAGLSAGVGILISLNASSVRQAQQTIGLAIMLFLFLPVFGFQALPRDMQTTIFEWIIQLNTSNVIYSVLALLFVIDLGLFLAALAKFQRQKLILD
jgi:ABC-2 type transport system permease protein